MFVFQRCSDTKVSDKTTFTTFARTLPPSSKVSKSVVALLVAFNWNKFVVVCGTDPASGSEVQEAIEVSFVIVFYRTRTRSDIKIHPVTYTFLHDWRNKYKTIET